MRLICREMSERRCLIDRIQKVLKRRLHGYKIDEVELERMKRRRTELDDSIPPLWEAIHNRMNRDRARRESREAQIGKMRSQHGNRTHP
jgi:hypothetical protein